VEQWVLQPVSIVGAVLVNQHHQLPLKAVPACGVKATAIFLLLFSQSGGTPHPVVGSPIANLNFISPALLDNTYISLD
jgi:hypothetical protein